MYKGSFYVNYSFIKNSILEETRKKLDISDAAQMPQFKKYYKGYEAKLKEADKGDTKHNEEFPEECLAKVWPLVSKIHEIIKAGDTSTEEFEDLINSIPDYETNTKQKRCKGTGNTTYTYLEKKIPI